MVHLAEGLRIVSVLLIPFLTDTAKRIQDILGVKDELLTSWESIAEFGDKVCGLHVTQTGPLFPRIDIKKELEALEEFADNRTLQKQKKMPAKEKQDEAPVGVITYDDFKKVQLKLGLVKQAETIEGSEKLLKLQVQVGSETRQIVSGIRKWYTPEQMTGKTVVVVANLKPAKLFGVESQGMLLAAEQDGDLKLVTIDGSLPSGAGVS
jgi:methionyl-tRNA synthetase